MILKIAVMESGAVLVDGLAIELASLDERLSALQAAGGSVWYHREPNANPDLGLVIVEKIVAHKLPISISSKPDFSDYLDDMGQSHPRADDLDAFFARVRATATGADGTRGLVLVRPDRQLFVLPALPESPELNAQAAGIEKLIPSAVKRNIAVIAATAFTAAAALSLADANRAIPFFGMLMGLSYVGHHVWVFEGHEVALTSGCRDADLLLVDSALLPSLAEGWASKAAAAMRNANILVHDRTTFKLRIVKKVGSGSGLDFLG